MKTMIKAMLAGMIITSVATAQQFERDEHPAGYKSPLRATAYSLLGTALPVGLGVYSARSGDPGGSSTMLITGGIIIGPATGYFYGDVSERGLTGTALRAALVGATVAAFSNIELMGPIFGNERSDSNRGKSGWIILAVFGPAFLAIDVLYDIAVVDDHVRKHNNKLSAQEAHAVTITPHYFADSAAAGLSLNITF